MPKKTGGRRNNPAANTGVRSKILHTAVKTEKYSKMKMIMLIINTTKNMFDINTFEFMVSKPIIVDIPNINMDM